MFFPLDQFRGLSSKRLRRDPQQCHAQRQLQRLGIWDLCYLCCR